MHQARSRPRVRAVSVMLIALFAALAASAGSREDAQLARDVRDRLDGATVLRTFSLDIVVQDGDVLLAGRVDRLADVDVAIRIASKVRGVLNVHSAIEISRAGRPDHVLEAAVKGAMRERPQIADGGKAVELVIEQGHVTLRGGLARGNERLALRRAAASVPGVISVTDELTTPAVEDDVLLGRLFALLARRGRARVSGRIEPSVEEGVVVLRGTVPRLYERIVAEEIAFTLTGVRAVVNEIEVEPPSREVPLIRP